MNASRAWLSLCVLVVPLAPTASAVDLNPGDLLVTIDAWPNPGRVLRIDPMTGQYDVVSEGNLLSWTNSGIAVDQQGQIYVAQFFGGPLVRIDAKTGAQYLVAQGGFLQNTHGVAIAPSGDVFASDYTRGL